MEAHEGETRAFWRPSSSSSVLAFVRLPEWKAPEVIRPNATVRGGDLHPAERWHEVVVRATTTSHASGRLVTNYTLEIPSLGVRWSSSSVHAAETTQRDSHDPPRVTFMMTNFSYWVEDCPSVPCGTSGFGCVFVCVRVIVCLFV